jgi:hypothetical protein
VVRTKLMENGFMAALLSDQLFLSSYSQLFSSWSEFPERKSRGRLLSNDIPQRRRPLFQPSF